MAAKDRRVVKTLRCIDNACWSLMQEKDFTEITIQDIVDRAEINRATFYRYYKDKYDWMEKKIQERMQEIHDISMTLFASESLEEMAVSEGALVKHFDTNFSTYSILLNNKGTAMFREELVNLLLDVKYKLHAKTASQAPLTDFRFHYGISSFVGVIVWWIKNDRPLSVEQLAQEIFAVHLKLQWFERE